MQDMTEIPALVFFFFFYKKQHVSGPCSFGEVFARTQKPRPQSDDIMSAHIKMNIWKIEVRTIEFCFIGLQIQGVIWDILPESRVWPCP